MSYVKSALLASASALGVHWIYDYHFLEHLVKKQSLLFIRQEKEIFDQANPSFFVYPNSKVGDVSVQGEILNWLYNALLNHKDFTSTDYQNLLYEQFKPGGLYTGYVETYAKNLVLKILLDSQKLDSSHVKLNDDTLVGFMPYIVAKELGFGLEKAWLFTNILTRDKKYLDYFKFFDTLLEFLRTRPLKESLEAVVSLAPEMHQNALQKAIELTDSNHFIKSYASRSCAYPGAIAVIFHILYHTSDFEQVLSKNALIGGASADRGLLLGMILERAYQIPADFLRKVDFNF